MQCADTKCRLADVPVVCASTVGGENLEQQRSPESTAEAIFDTTDSLSEYLSPAVSARVTTATPTLVSNELSSPRALSALSELSESSSVPVVDTIAVSTKLPALETTLESSNALETTFESSIDVDDLFRLQEQYLVPYASPASDRFLNGDVWFNEVDLDTNHMPVN